MNQQHEPQTPRARRMAMGIFYIGILVWTLVFIQALARLAVIYQQSGGSIVVVAIHFAMIGGIAAAILGLMTATKGCLPAQAFIQVWRLDLRFWWWCLAP